MQLSEGIYFESKPASGHNVHGQFHAYLVFQDGHGGERVIRGGPKLATASKIQVETDIPLSQSKDAYEEGESPSTRNSKSIDLNGRNPEAIWKDMVKRAKEIDRAGIDYNLFNDDLNTGDGESRLLTRKFDAQNSNSVVRGVLDFVDLDVKKIITKEQF
jgi:hypothetical protein